MSALSPRRAWRRASLTALARGAASATLALACGLGVAAAAAAEDTPAQNVYRAGPAVRVDAPVVGDLLAAGGRVAIDQPVSRDAALAGGRVSVRADVGEDLRAVGGQVSVDARVGGDANLAGGRITLGKGSSVGGSAWIAGGSVELAGKLPARTRVHAGHVLVDGEVDGDLFVQAESLELGPAARIRGTLNYASTSELQRDPAAQVGAVVRQPVTERHAARHRVSTPSPFKSVMLMFGVLAAGIVWTLLFPRLAQDAQARLARTPGPSVAMGALVVLAAPLVIVILLVTIVGAPLALALAAAYGLLLLAGYLVVAGALGERLLKAVGTGPTPTVAQSLLGLAVALLLLAVLGALPFLGRLLTVVAVMAGAGALVGHWRARPSAPSAPSAPATPTAPASG